MPLLPSSSRFQMIILFEYYFALNIQGPFWIQGNICSHMESSVGQPSAGGIRPRRQPIYPSIDPPRTMRLRDTLLQHPRGSDRYFDISKSQMTIRIFTPLPLFRMNEHPHPLPIRQDPWIHPSLISPRTRNSPPPSISISSQIPSAE